MGSEESREFRRREEGCLWSQLDISSSLWKALEHELHHSWSVIHCKPFSGGAGMGGFFYLPGEVATAAEGSSPEERAAMGH